MSLEIVEVGPQVVGKQLGQKLFSTKGSLLLGQGTEISGFHHTHIKEAGYRSVYVLDGADQVVIVDEPQHVLAEQLRARLPRELREIFSQLLSDDNIVISEGKKLLNQFTDTLVSAVQRKYSEPPVLLDLKRQDDYPYQHAINVAAYSVLVGQRLGYHQMKLYDLAIGALVSNIGMLFIDKSILSKPGELTEKEFQEVEKHTALGFQHLGRKCFMKGLITIVAMQHHERYDGSGYPSGLRADKIHDYSHIVAVADFFDAYTSDRPYRRLHTVSDALEYIKGQAGREFEPRIASTFLSIFE